jgi:excisionase family DNA binding protein
MNHTDPDVPELLTVAEVARWLRVDVRTVYRWVRVAQIPHVRAGRGLRFTRSHVEAWIRRRSAR